MCDHRLDGVPGERPAIFPTVDTLWQGKPPQRMSTGGTWCQSMVVTSPRFGASGQVVGEHSGDGFVEVGDPDRLCVEDVLDGEVESAVSGEQRPDPQGTGAGRWLVSCMRAPAVR